MGKKLFVEGFPESDTDQQLYDLFAPFGRVVSARVVRGHRGESLRFGFVEMASDEEAVRAQAALHGTLREGHSLIVTFAQ
ncbi:MAG: RNA-binding protein [Nitrospira sp. CR2.1]|nr:RNA-binding protein [Nitrospira sp. CR2.1]